MPSAPRPPADSPLQSTPLAGESKVLFTGPSGAGKTTAIRSLSHVGAFADSQFGEDGEAPPPPFDYGEFWHNGVPVRMYGAPERKRFDFMWKVLSDEAMGLVVLLDHQRPDPASDALRYVQSFAALARRGACVVGIGRFDATRAPSLRAISDRLETAGYRVPVLEIDARRKADVLLLMQTLVTMARRQAPAPAPMLSTTQSLSTSH